MKKKVEGAVAVPDVEEVEKEVKELKEDPDKTCSENGVPPVEMAKRVLVHQGSELSNRFKAANVRHAMETQGYSDSDIKTALKETGLDQ